MKSLHTVKVIGTKNHGALWASIASGIKEETPPEGSISVADFSKTYGVTIRQAEHALRRREQAGELKSGKFKQSISGALRSVLFYWGADA
jgi:hypothetical protein